MENTIRTINPDIINGQNANRSYFLNNFPAEVIERNPVFERLAVDGHKNFFDYVGWLGLAKDPNLIVLSPSHHYYYDAEDLKEVTTVLNVKQLNHIKQVKEFLQTVYHTLPDKSYFVGSFIDWKYQFGFFPNSNSSQQQPGGTVDQVENGIASSIPFLNLMYNFIDSKTNRNLTKKSVTTLLKEVGLKVLDMSEIQGLTFFCSQKV
jgi:hypothetical protein